MRGGRAGEIRAGEISDGLVERLQAIASPNRLQLLMMLQTPKPVSAIDLAPSANPGDRDRNISRQGVRHHIDKLRKTGFVKVKESDERGNRVHEYVTDRRQLYELGEILRSMPYALSAPPVDMGVPPCWEPLHASTPTLTVVHGAEIGRSFALGKDANLPGRGWVIGASPDVDVCLDYDSYVSRQAAEIERSEDGFHVIDLRAASRRVSVNGQRLERGELRELEDGDLVGVGRSILWFRR